ncbi:hypothetical protein PMI34_02763 [Pseudomonas sp. GM74]|nr:hypothetical protein PMI34_02763 [Pseudomonas sp. GM74]
MRREVNGFKSDAKQLWERACSGRRSDEEGGTFNILVD